MRAAILALVIAVSACAPKGPPAFFGLIEHRPQYAEPYQELGQYSGQPYAGYAEGTLDSLKIPNTYSEDFLLLLEDRLRRDGFIVDNHISNGETTLKNYWNAETRERYGLSMKRVSFEDTMFTLSIIE